MFGVALLLPAEVHQPGKKHIDHVVDLVDLDLEVEQRTLEGVELVGGILRVHLPVSRLALFVSLLEVLILFFLQQGRSRVLSLKLADDELRGQLLYLLDHVEFLHEDVAIALIGSHFELFEQGECDKSVETDSSHQDQDNHYPWHSILQYVFAKAHSGQRYYYDFEAVVEWSVLRGKEEAVREEYHHCYIDPYDLYDIHIVQDYFPCELKGHLRLDAVQIDDPCSARRVIQRRADVQGQWKEESGEECQMQEKRVIAPKRIRTDQQQHYLEHCTQNHVFLAYHPCLIVLVVKHSRYQHTSQQQYSDSSLEQCQTVNDSLFSDIVHLINGHCYRENRGI